MAQANRDEFTIDLYATDPTKEGAVWTSKMVATVKDRSKRPPDTPVKIQFFAEGVMVGGPVTTSSDFGKAEEDAVFDKPGRKVIEAQIVGTSYTRRITINAIADKKDGPKLVESIRTSEAEIRPGLWLVTFIARGTDGNPVAGAVIEVLDSTQASGRVELAPTDAAGRTHYQFQFPASDPEGTKRSFPYSCGKVQQTKYLWR